MKKSLALLSSVAFCTLIGNNMITINNLNSNVGSNLKQQTSSNSDKELFNNKFNYLNDGKLITNQSKSDNNFYSYDVSYADFKLSNGTDARTIFSVDDNGQLQFDEKLVPTPDLNNIKNILEQIKSHKEVTNIKSRYNDYSKSVYSTSYFSGVGSNWQYIQQGGAQKNIDISSQKAAKKVEYSNNLSEPLGLYYIAKAVRTEGGIDEKVGIDLAKYFIAQSSLQQTSSKDGIDDKLTTKILDLIVTNDNIYNFIYFTPLTVTTKNYSMNYIFDSNNNLMEIYYNYWNKAQVISYTNYSWNKTYTSWLYDKSNQYTMLSNWNQYANSWDEFVKFYPVFFGWQGTIFKISNDGGQEQDTNSLGMANTKNITTEAKSLFSLHVYVHDASIPPTPTSANFYFFVWHDNNNIYFQWHYDMVGSASIAMNINFATVSFSN